MGYFACAVKVLVIQFLAFNMIICLIIASAAEKIEVPFTSKACL
jgi:hypothetical protein